MKKKKLFELLCRAIVFSFWASIALAGGILYAVLSPILVPTEDGTRSMKNRL